MNIYKKIPRHFKRSASIIAIHTKYLTSRVLNWGRSSFWLTYRTNKFITKYFYVGWSEVGIGHSRSLCWGREWELDSSLTD